MCCHRVALSSRPSLSCLVNRALLMVNEASAKVLTMLGEWTDPSIERGYSWRRGITKVYLCNLSSDRRPTAPTLWMRVGTHCEMTKAKCRCATLRNALGQNLTLAAALLCVLTGMVMAINVLPSKQKPVPHDVPTEGAPPPPP